MNPEFTLTQLQAWKPVLTALVLPPVPLMVMVLAGVALARTRRAALGRVLALAGVLLLWATSTMAVAEALTDAWLRPPPALSPEQVQALRGRAARGEPVAIVVLGGGREALAPEYAAPNLTENSVTRLRYGIWLSRQTTLPMAFSGGVGWAASGTGASEAQIAARIAQQEFGHPLRWIETESRDTHENATRVMAMLRDAGVREVLLVTHGWHMPRALVEFRRAAGDGVAITPAPMGLARSVERDLLRWLPSPEGYGRVRFVLRETLGRWVAG